MTRCTVRATEDLAVFFHSVPDYPALATAASRGKFLNGTFETVERILITPHDYLERSLVFISTCFAFSHTILRYFQFSDHHTSFNVCPEQRHDPAQVAWQTFALTVTPVIPNQGRYPHTAAS